VVLTVVEETNGVESVRRELREFWDEKRNNTGRATIIGLNLSTIVHKVEPLVIVLDLISNGSGLKPLLVKVLLAAIQD
jgi:hypothetical protein